MAFTIIIALTSAYSNHFDLESLLLSHVLVFCKLLENFFQRFVIIDCIQLLDRDL